MWAWYHVVVFCAEYQNTVPNAKKAVVATRAKAPTPNRPTIHQQIATSSAASAVKKAWSSVASPKIATIGTNSRAGNGGNGMSPRSAPPAGATGRTSWKYQLPMPSVPDPTG
jgi:hypothetical protein